MSEQCFSVAEKATIFYLFSLSENSLNDWLELLDSKAELFLLIIGGVSKCIILKKLKISTFSLCSCNFL